MPIPLVELDELLMRVGLASQRNFLQSSTEATIGLSKKDRSTEVN